MQFQTIPLCAIEDNSQLYTASYNVSLCSILLFIQCEPADFRLGQSSPLGRNGTDKAERLHAYALNQRKMNLQPQITENSITNAARTCLGRCSSVLFQQLFHVLVTNVLSHPLSIRTAWFCMCVCATYVCSLRFALVIVFIMHFTIAVATLDQCSGSFVSCQLSVVRTRY